MRLIRSFQLSRLSNGLVEVAHNLGPVPPSLSAPSIALQTSRVRARRGVTAFCEAVKNSRLSVLKGAVLFSPIIVVN
jgi:hypothetical protein